MLKFSVLASGSGGNACYVATEQARILIDAGLSCRELTQRLNALGEAPKKLDALIITHEHTDHIRGAGPVARRFGLPVYLNRMTHARGRKAMGKLPRVSIIETGRSFSIKDVCVETFTKCHDAADPMGIVLSRQNGGTDPGETRIGIVTDLGRSTALVEDRLQGCRALIMEFNYDPELLERGPYPLDLKRRIRGQDGHLSNGQAGDLLRSVSHRDLDFVLLAHLSENNNDPVKAREAAADALEAGGCAAARIIVTRQDRAVPMIYL